MKNYKQLCVWSGVVLEDENGPISNQMFEEFFKDEFGVRVKLKCQQTTNPDRDNWGDDIPETGGRNDVFFYIHKDDISIFAVPRLRIGIRWWEDVIKYNENSSHLYSREFIESNPTNW